MPMQALRLDPYEHQFHWDPYPTYQALREQDPVHYNEELDLWFLTKWDDVFAAFRDFKSFINTGATSLEKGSTEALPYPMFIRSEEHTSELQSLMRISYAVFCLKKKKKTNTKQTKQTIINY